jgi:hypothetical protein
MGEKQSAAEIKTGDSKELTTGGIRRTAGRLAPWAVDQFDGGRIVNWKTGSPKRMLAACRNRVIGPVNAARFMTAASIS